MVGEEKGGERKRDSSATNIVGGWSQNNQCNSLPTISPLTFYMHAVPSALIIFVKYFTAKMKL
jgi:hypothetical protein